MAGSILSKFIAICLQKYQQNNKIHILNETTCEYKFCYLNINGNNKSQTVFAFNLTKYMDIKFSFSKWN